MDAKLGHETDALTFLSDSGEGAVSLRLLPDVATARVPVPMTSRAGGRRFVRLTSRSGWDRIRTWRSPRRRSRRSSSARTARRRACRCRLFGLLGPNGPLPIHITEYARHRLRHAGDPTLSRFLDLFHHRFIALFYRAWAQAQPHVNRDRAGHDRFLMYIGSFIGIAPQSLRHRDTVPDLAKLFHVGTLVRQVRNADGLAAIIRQFFRVPARIEEFVGHWLLLAPRDRTYLRPRAGPRRGRGARRARVGPSEQVPHSPRTADADAVRSVPAGDATGPDAVRSARGSCCESSWTGSGSTSVSSSIGTSGCTSSAKRCPR